MTKTCKQCGKDKELSSFRPNRAICRSCNAKAAFQKIKADPAKKEKQYAHVRKYRKDNNYTTEHRKRQKKTDFFAWKLKAVKVSAKSCGLECTISASDLRALNEKQHGLCALSGVVMTLGDGSLNTMSVDRIHQNIGYVAGNVRLVTHQVNSARAFGTDAELIVMCQNILKSKEK